MDVSKFLDSLTTKKIILIICVVGFIVFANSLTNGFVGDDISQIINNRSVHSISNIPAFFTASTFDFGNGSAGIYYKPLLTTTFSIVYSVFGQNAFFFHLLDVSLHIANAVLLFILFKKFINREWAFFLAIVFLVHPLNQDVAAYISNTQDALFFFFGIGALLLESSTKIKHLNLKVFTLLMLSLLSKETAVAIVLINFFYVFLFKRERIKKTAIYSTILAIVYAFIHYSVVGIGFALRNYDHISRLTLFERMMSIPKIIYFYLQNFIFPNKLVVVYDWTVTRFNFVDFYLPLLFVILFLCILLFFGKIIRLKNLQQFYIYIFFAFWFFVGLGFHLQIIPLDGTVAPRWFYLPMAGLLGLTGTALNTLVSNLKIKMAVYILFLVLIIMFSVRTIIRNFDFKDNLTLMCHDADETHDSFRLEYACGGSLFLAGFYNKAQPYFDRTNELAPYYGWFGLGSLYQKKAEANLDKAMLLKAENAYKNAIKFEPNLPYGYEGLGGVYTFDSKDLNNAKIFLEESVRKFPKDFILWKYLATIEYKLGNKQSAAQDIERAYLLKPDDYEVQLFYYNLTNNVPITFRQFDFE